MTVREYVEKRKTLIGRVQLMWGVVMVSSSPALTKLPLVILAMFFLIWLAVMITIAPMMRLMLRCPRCHGVLLQPVFRRMTPTPDICPYCGMSLDKPMESPGNLP
jgi:hypothetical protein